MDEPTPAGGSAHANGLHAPAGGGMHATGHHATPSVAQTSQTNTDIGEKATRIYGDPSARARPVFTETIGKSQTRKEKHRREARPNTVSRPRVENQTPPEWTSLHQQAAPRTPTGSTHQQAAACTPLGTTRHPQPHRRRAQTATSRCRDTRNTTRHLHPSHRRGHPSHRRRQSVAQTKTSVAQTKTSVAQTKTSVAQTTTNRPSQRRRNRHATF